MSIFQTKIVIQQLFTAKVFAKHPLQMSQLPVLPIVSILMIINPVSSEIVEAYHIGENLQKQVSSSDIFSRYENGDCKYPGICDIDINKCNIPKVPLSSLTYDTFIDNYVIKQQPVILQVENVFDIIDNSSQIWEWNKIISMVRSFDDYQNIYYKNEYENGTPQQRSDTTDIHPLNDRDRDDKNGTYKLIINSIKSIPSIFGELDIFNDLVEYLKHGDDPLLGNKWVIFGNTGSGAQFHFDYYLTSFWNLVIQGSKYWILISPDIVEGYLFKSQKDRNKVITMPIWQFLLEIYPYIKNEEYLLQCKQEVGDIMYAPTGFYHSTINLNATLSISRNMITKFNYKQVFEFVTSLQSMNGINTETKEIIGIKHAVNLCAGLYHYNATMWRQTLCASKLFLQRLNSFPLLFDQGDNAWNWYYHIGKERHITNSLLYIQACNWAIKHPQYSSFRYS